MKRFIEALYDRVAGYAFLCWICQRPVFSKPPPFSWLIEEFIADGDELEMYLQSLGVKYDAGRIGRGNSGVESLQVSRRFSDIAEFNRERDLK